MSPSCLFYVLQVQVSIQFLSTLPQSSAKSAALHDLFVKMLADNLTETLYMSSMAELHCDIIGTDSSLVIKGKTIKSYVRIFYCIHYNRRT